MNASEHFLTFKSLDDKIIIILVDDWKDNVMKLTCIEYIGTALMFSLLTIEL